MEGALGGNILGMIRLQFRNVLSKFTGNFVRFALINMAQRGATYCISRV